LRSVLDPVVAAVEAAKKKNKSWVWHVIIIRID
jgi:hypothetical protein